MKVQKSWSNFEWFYRLSCSHLLICSARLSKVPILAFITFLQKSDIFKNERVISISKLSLKKNTLYIMIIFQQNDVYLIELNYNYFTVLTKNIPSCYYDKMLPWQNVILWLNVTMTKCYMTKVYLTKRYWPFTTFFRWLFGSVLKNLWDSA